MYLIHEDTVSLKDIFLILSFYTPPRSPRFLTFFGCMKPGDSEIGIKHHADKVTQDLRDFLQM